VKIIMLNHKIT